MVVADKNNLPKNGKPEDFKFEDTDSLKAQVMSALNKSQREQAEKTASSSKRKKVPQQDNFEGQTRSQRNQSAAGVTSKNGKTAPHDNDRFSRRIQERLEQEKRESEKKPVSKKQPAKSGAKKKASTGAPKTAARISGSSASGKAAAKQVSAKKAATPKATSKSGDASKAKTATSKNIFAAAKLKSRTAGKSLKAVKTGDNSEASKVKPEKRPATSSSSDVKKKSVTTSNKTSSASKNAATENVSRQTPKDNQKFLPKSTRQRLGEALAIPTDHDDEMELNGAARQQATQGEVPTQARQNVSQTNEGPQRGNQAQGPGQSATLNNNSASGQNDSQQTQTKSNPTPEHAELLKKIPKQKKKSISTFLEEVEQLPEMQQRQEIRKKENSIVRRIVTILLVVFAIVAIITGISLWNFWESGQKPLDTSNSKTELVEIPLGSSNKQIAGILEKDKIIKSAVVFNYYMKLNNKSGFQAGFYKLAPNMTLDKIAKKLTDGDSEKQTLLVPEGYSADQIAATVEKDTPYTSDEFLAVLKDKKFFSELLKDFPKLLTSANAAKDERYKLEGYLFPATYTLTPGSDAEGLVYQMVQKSDEVLSQYYDEIAAQKLTVHQVLTLASLVEKEGVKDEDRRNIAGVFFNRLATDMPLQSDISILYAKNEHKVNLTVEDTQVDSPYNLYIHKGYGPGPFNNPSENAIKAVLYPAGNDYYYFVADVETGQVYFAQTFEEHNALVAQYVNKK